MFEHLQIYDSGERIIVGLADVALGAITWPFRVGRSAGQPGEAQRVLVLRLERIGDLLMVFDALAALRVRLPAARIDLVVGSWNAPLAQAMAVAAAVETLGQAMAVADTVDTLDAPWLARGAQGAHWPAMIARARQWRQQRYDLAINFEPDIRTNLLLGISGARRRIGWFTGGGGACLTQAAAYDPRLHTRDNALRLVELACPGSPHAGPGGPVYIPAASLTKAPPYILTEPTSDVGRPFRAGGHVRLVVPEAARERARALLGAADDGRRFVGLHASGGRAIKQWHLDRFATVATALGREYGAAVVLTGTDADAPLVQSVKQAIAPDVPVIDACGDLDLLTLAAVLERCALFVTGDTGPMHLAAAVDTPTVAIFGPSDPARYHPLTSRHRVARIDLPCSPCNRIRRPPERCRGHVPDCLDGITVEQVLAAAKALLMRT